ncbi:carboxymuconolactone decarboxylase family protein [Patescibacteria group bacterium]
MTNEFTRVKVISDKEVQGVAEQVFQQLVDKQGGVPNWARVMANRPEILATFMRLLGTSMGPGLVEQDNKWKMAYAVSEVNKCEYCVGVAGAMLEKLGVAKENIEDVISEKAKLKADEKIAVEYAESVTKDANAVSDEQFAALKEHYNDEQIVELTAVIGLFNYINRFNDALRVLPE